MTPGPSIYYECISCKKTIEITTINSGNTFGVRYWTDGFMIAQMLPDTLIFGKCPHCRNLFWTKDLKHLGEVDWLGGDDLPDKAWGKTKTALEFETSDYLSALENNFYTDNEEEKILRIRAWWKFNNIYRNRRTRKSFFGTPEIKRIPEKLFYENLTALENMLDENIQSERLQKAEILRELGRFEECEKLLDFEFDDSLLNVKEFILKCCEEKSSIVQDMTDYFKEKQYQAKEEYTLQRNKYIEEGINFVKSQAIAKGLATEDNFYSVIQNLTVKEFVALRGDYMHLHTIHFPKSLVR